jgi:hypothetical protein
MLAKLAPASEAILLEQLECCAEEKPAVRLAAGCDLWDCLDETAAPLGDFRKRAFECGAGDALPAVTGVDVEALDPPIRAWWQFRGCPAFRRN